MLNWRSESPNPGKVKQSFTLLVMKLLLCLAHHKLIYMDLIYPFLRSDYLQCLDYLFPITPRTPPKADTQRPKAHIALLKGQIQIVKKMCLPVKDNPQQLALLLELEESIMEGLDMLMEEL